MLDKGSTILPSLDATVYYRYLEEEWTRWPHQDTPFPPLQAYPLKGRFLVLHGCAIVTSSGKAIAFIAPSMAGKTTLLMELCRRGYSALSDDLLFIEPASNQIVLYRKPVGVREGALRLFPELVHSNVLWQALCFEAYGSSPKTWLVHLDELMPNCYYSHPLAPIQACVFLDRDGKGGVKPIEPSQAILHMLPQVISSGLNAAKTLQCVVELVEQNPAYCLDVTNLNQACDHIEHLVENVLAHSVTSSHKLL